MKVQMKLASRVGVALAVTTLVGASAFAESRPSNETRGRRDGGAAIRRGTPTQRSTASRGDESSNASRRREATVERRSERGTNRRSDAEVTVRGDRVTRGDERNRSRDTDRSVERRSAGSRDTRDARGAYDRERSNNDSRNRGTYDRDRSGNDSRNRGSYDRERSSRDSRNRGSYDRGRDGRRDETWRSGRSSSSHRSNNYGRSNHYRQPHYSRGRISQVLRYGGGYRVWIHGASYPFYIPLAHYRHDRFRVGLSIHLGGYYNPLGYYDYYDGTSDGELRGTVESVDYRDDTFVVRNDATGSFVTVVARDRGTDVRPGDYVELSGEWTRGGAFQAWDVDLLDDGYRR